jgi:hypothetical protein
VKKILIAVSPGYFRNSLVALVRTLSQAQVATANDQLPAILEAASRFSPDILILDGNALEGVERLRECLPVCRFLFMADHIAREGMGRKSGWDIVLPKSVSTGDLFSALYSLTAEIHPSEMEPAYGYA